MNKLFKLLVKLIIVIIVLIIVLYFIATSSFFIRKVVLPIVGHQINGTVTVDSIEVSPLRSRIAFTNLSLKTEDITAKVKMFESDFKLFALFSNNIKVSKFVLEDSDVEIVSKQKENAIEAGKGKEVQTKPVSQEPIKLYKLNIKDVKIANFNLKYTAQRTDESLNTVSEIKNFCLEVPYFETSGKALANFSSGIVTSTTSDTLSGSFKGKLFAELNDKTFPKEMVFSSLLNLGNDSSPINVRFESSEAFGKTPFSLSASVSKLPLQPFFQTFLVGSYKKTDGYIDSFNLNGNGSDLGSVTSLDGVNGNMDILVRNIYVPASLDHSPILGVLLLPIDVISKLDTNISGKIFNAKADDVLDTSKEALTGAKIIEFKTGSVKAVMNNGNVDIKEFIFIGASGSAVKKMDIKGTIDKNQSININTITNLGGLVIPIHITGTINDPKPDTVSLVNSMLKGTADTVGNILETVAQKGEGNINSESVLNAVDSITGSLSGNSSEGGGDSVGNLINSFKNFGK